MNSVFSVLFPNELFGKEYRTHEEYLADLVKQVELMLVYFLECSPAPSQHLDKFKGLIVTKNQVDDVFQMNKDINENRDVVRKEYIKSSFFIQSRLKANVDIASIFTFEYVKQIYRLNELECFCLILSMLPIMDNKYQKVFSYLQDDLTQKTAGYDLALKLYYFVEDVSDIVDFYYIRKTLEEKMSSLCYVQGTTEVDPRLLSFIMTNGQEPIDIKGVYCHMPDQFSEPLPVMEEFSFQLYDVVKKYDNKNTVYFNLNGPNGIGRKTQVIRFSDLTEISTIMVDVAQLDLKDSKEFYNSVITACREAIMMQGLICFQNFDVLFSPQYEDEKYADVLLGTAYKFSNIIFVLSEKPVKDEVADEHLWIDVQMQYPNKDESIILWQRCLEQIPLSEEVEAFELANKFTFTPGQIDGTRRDALKLKIWSKDDIISKRDLYNCAYNQIVHNLNKQATLIYAKYTWDQLILADEQKEMLKNACDQIKYKHIVYDQWGFNERLAYGRGVSMLFAGPPGTGKTMAAQVVANELNIEIYKVDLSQIVSKYIGETEKNLNELFSEAKKSNVILFFDETDALLGKRTEVKDSHDKNANLETSYLLQKMEEYDGITVMSTNYLENIDNAFFRRITYVIHFPFPDVQSRKRIWQTMFPKKVPLSKDIDFDYLAKQFEIAGGNIKNIAVTASFLAAKSSNELKMEHIIKAIKYELTKQGKSVLKEDFGEHGYLLNR